LTGEIGILLCYFIESSFFPANGVPMRYQDSQYNESKSLEKFLPVVNLVLFLVIATCFNYLMIDFLF